jgi:hypothetical protein
MGRDAHTAHYLMALVQGEGLQGPGQGLCIHLLTVDPITISLLVRVRDPAETREAIKAIRTAADNNTQINLS